MPRAAMRSDSLTGGSDSDDWTACQSAVGEICPSRPCLSSSSSGVSTATASGFMGLCHRKPAPCFRLFNKGACKCNTGFFDKENLCNTDFLSYFLPPKPAARRQIPMPIDAHTRRARKVDFLEEIVDGEALIESFSGPFDNGGLRNVSLRTHCCCCCCTRLAFFVHRVQCRRRQPCCCCCC